MSVPEVEVQSQAMMGGPLHVPAWHAAFSMYDTLAPSWEARPAVALTVMTSGANVGVLVRRNGDRSQDADDRDHDHQFDQGETFLDFHRGSKE